MTDWSDEYAWARAHPAIWSVRLSRHAAFEGIADLHDAMVALDRMGERDAPLTPGDVEQLPPGDLPGVLHRLLEYHREPARFTDAAAGCPALADAIDRECIRVAGLVLARFKRQRAEAPAERSGSLVVLDAWQDCMVPRAELDRRYAAARRRNLEIMRRRLPDSAFRARRS